MLSIPIVIIKLVILDNVSIAKRIATKHKKMTTCQKVIVIKSRAVIQKMFQMMVS